VRNKELPVLAAGQNEQDIGRLEELLELDKNLIGPNSPFGYRLAD